MIMPRSSSESESLSSGLNLWPRTVKIQQAMTHSEGVYTETTRYALRDPVSCAIALS